MPRTGRPGLTHREKRELWHRWKAGQTLNEIGRALNKHAGSVHGVLAVTGGIEPRPRKRSSHALQLHEREEVSRGLGRGFSLIVHPLCCSKCYQRSGIKSRQIQT